jgi:hypothetical protein
MFFKLWVRAPRITIASFDELKENTGTYLSSRFPAASKRLRAQPAIFYYKSCRNPDDAHNNAGTEEGSGKPKPSHKRVELTSMKTSAKRRYAARAGACTREEEKWKLVVGISDAISLRFNTHDKPSNAEEAHAGHCVAQLPTQSQSWQR